MRRIVLRSVYEGSDRGAMTILDALDNLAILTRAAIAPESVNGRLCRESLECLREDQRGRQESEQRRQATVEPETL